MTTLTFLGAARTVTGSKYLVRTDSQEVLVDCGLYQGLKELRLRNWERFPVEPASLDAVWTVRRTSGGKAVTGRTSVRADSTGTRPMTRARLSEDDAPAQSHAAMSVPYGTGEGGLPIGVQVLAPALGEPVMFRVARVLEETA